MSYIRLLIREFQCERNMSCVRKITLYIINIRNDNDSAVCVYVLQ